MSPGSAGVTCKFTVEMKARRILHEKTQGFLRGRWRREEGVYINKEQRLMTSLNLHACLMLRHVGLGGVGWGVMTSLNLQCTHV